MRIINILLFCCFLSGVLPLFADEVKPLNLSEGEKYELRTVQTTISSYTKNGRIEQRKVISSDLYDFSVLEAHRKKGFLVEMCIRRSSQLVLKKSGDSPRWKELMIQHSDVVSSRWKDLIQSSHSCPELDSVFLVRLSPNLQAISVECGCSSGEANKQACEGLLEQVQQFFSSGKISAYHVSDTLVQEEHPEGISYFGDWNTKVYHVTKEIKNEVRFSRVNTVPFSVICEGDRDEYVTWPQANTVVRGEVKGNWRKKDTVIRVTCFKSFPMFQEKTYRIPVIDGKFEFRQNLSDYAHIQLENEHTLFLEPGDDLFITMDSLNDKELEFSGLGAGNNRYYTGEGHSWGFSLYRINRDKMCSRDYYMQLDEKADYYRKRMEERKEELSPCFYQFMLDFFKYRPVYQKLMADRDSTVGEFDCIKDIEICNPLAGINDEYMSVLRHVMLFVMSPLLADVGGAQMRYEKKGYYDMAGVVLDGKVLNAFLVKWISEELVSDFEKGKMLYEQYKRDYEKSPYTGLLDEQYQKAAMLAKGGLAPDFTLKNPDGKEVSLSDFRGKVVYIDFWSLGCGPCMYEFKTATPVLKEHFKDREVVFLNIIAACDEKAWKKMMADYHITGVNLMDTKEGMACKNYMVGGFPRYVLVGKDGKLIENNAPRPSQGHVKELIEAALK